MPGDAFPLIQDAGDRGVLVLFGDSLDMAVNNAAHAFDRSLKECEWPEVLEITPAIRGVLVQYDPVRVAAAAMHERIRTLLDSRDWLAEDPIPGRRLWRLPVHYGEESGPDIAGVAGAMGCDIDEVVREHCSLSLRVLMLGFAPGCAYLGTLPERWDLPRLDHVKPLVPPGSISVAVRQSVLFATPIPTGWQTIGCTPFRSFSRTRPPYFFLAPGDEVSFTPIDAGRMAELSAAVEAGEMIVTPEPLP